MERDVAVRLERMLVAEPVDDDYHQLRIRSVFVTSTDAAPVQVSVSWIFEGHTGRFFRPFAPHEVQILSGPTPEAEALALATWVRNDLVEYISELIDSGGLRDE